MWFLYSAKKGTPNAFWLVSIQIKVGFLFYCVHYVCMISCVLFICSNNDKCCSLQRFYMVKPCPKEMKCDVEVSSNLTYLFLIIEFTEYMRIYMTYFLWDPAMSRGWCKEQINASRIIILRGYKQYSLCSALLWPCKKSDHLSQWDLLFICKRTHHTWGHSHSYISHVAMFKTQVVGSTEWWDVTCP